LEKHSFLLNDIMSPFRSLHKEAANTLSLDKFGSFQDGFQHSVLSSVQSIAKVCLTQCERFSLYEAPLKEETEPNGKQ
jgi:hypothetical protein